MNSKPLLLLLLTASMAAQTKATYPHTYKNVDPPVDLSQYELGPDPRSVPARAFSQEHLKDGEYTFVFTDTENQWRCRVASVFPDGARDEPTVVTIICMKQGKLENNEKKGGPK